MNSDAHFMTDIANRDHSMPIVEAAEFPKKLDINYSAAQFEAYIAANRAREKEIQQNHTKESGK